MDVIASSAWLNEHVHTDLAPDAFARELSLKSMSVEKTEQLAPRFAHMVVGLVNEVRPHPNADRLRVVTVSIGDTATEIVCGGANVVEGMRVCVALPGARVRWHGKGDLVTLAEVEIRGVKSVGMICAPAEVGFDALETGERDIWDLTPLTDAMSGTPLAEALGLDDTLFTIEVTTNRPDAKGIVGLAREASAAVGAPFSWHPSPLPEGSDDMPFTVTIDDRARCLRQMAVVIDDVTVAPSPWWLQKRLLLAGIRPMNTIVDITNYVMLEQAQPLHAFDYRALDGAEIRVRSGRPGEVVTALDGKTYNVDGVLVLADSVKPLDIAGIMGGEETGTTSATKTVVLSASAFAPVAIRRASRALTIQSDAQLLFEKGLSVEAPSFALARAVELVVQLAGGKVASRVCDARVHHDAPLVFPLRPDKLREKIGVPLSDERIAAILMQLGFAIDQSTAPWTVTVPWWRDHDIEGEVDFSEEVARMVGYHEMPSVLPSGTPPTTPEDASLTWERTLKRLLVAAGYDEFFSNSFLAAQDLARYGEDPAEAYALANPLSSEETHMRTSLMPSLLVAIERNQAHTPAARCFECARVYMKRAHDLPDERMQLLLAEYGYDDAEAAFMRTKGVLEMFAAKAGVALTFTRDDGDRRWHPTRTARVLHDNRIVGRIGEVAEEVQMAFGVDRRVMAATLDIESLVPSLRMTHRYVPIAAYPSMTRDLSVLVDERVAFAALVEAMRTGIVRDVELVDIYRGNGVPEGKKSMTFSCTLAADDRTLTSEEADAALRHVGEVLVSQFGGILRA